MGEEDPERAGRYRERAALFARDFVHWFAPTGRPFLMARLDVPLCPVGVLVGAAYAGLEGFRPGELKG